MVMMRKLLERRSKKRRWIYVLCGGVALLFGILSAGMEDDLLGLIPYLLIVAVCVIQFLRPTPLGCSVLIAAFAAYTAAALVSSRQPVNEFFVFVLIGALPTLGLLWAWPKPLGTLEGTDTGLPTP